MLLGIHHGRVKYPGQEEKPAASGEGRPEKKQEGQEEPAIETRVQGDGGPEALLVDEQRDEVTVDPER